MLESGQLLSLNAQTTALVRDLWYKLPSDSFDALVKVFIVDTDIKTILRRTDSSQTNNIQPLLK